MPDTSGSGQAVGTFISPQITDRTAYMMHVRRGWYYLHLKERDPTSQWTAGPGGEFYHSFERHLDHGDQEQQSTTWQIAFVSYCHVSRKGCIRIVTVSVHFPESERMKRKWERKRKTQRAKECVLRMIGDVHVCVCEARAQAREAGWLVQVGCWRFYLSESALERFPRALATETRLVSAAFHSTPELKHFIKWINVLINSAPSHSKYHRKTDRHI